MLIKAGDITNPASFYYKLYAMFVNIQANIKHQTKLYYKSQEQLYQDLKTMDLPVTLTVKYMMLQFIATHLFKCSPTVSFSSLPSFKRSLKNTDFTPYMKCPV